MELVLAHAHNTVLGSLLLTNLCQGLFVLCFDIKVAMLNTELGNKELFFAINNFKVLYKIAASNK